MNEDFLVEMIRMNTGGFSWDEHNDNNIKTCNGLLTVTQSPAVHREIQVLILRLRQFK